METNILTLPSNPREHHVVFLDKQRIQVSDGKTGKIQSLDFPATIVRDGDIVDNTSFSQSLLPWVKSLSLLPGTASLILANGVCFGINLSHDSDEKKDAEISAFIESVPFSLVRERQITLGITPMEIAANKEFYDQVRIILGSCALPVVEVLPLCVLDGVAGKRWMDTEMAQYIQNHRESLKRFNLLDPEEVPVSTSNLLVNKEKPMQVYILLSVFGALVIILLYLLFGR
ncbi:hypothetical protein HY947_03160 [Candidatus Gottesmanbacteria bacterium]|nr:hypothetical protein [Candidatus Gottesmanbacteria bacterium]